VHAPPCPVGGSFSSESVDAIQLRGSPLIPTPVNGLGDQRCAGGRST
jgi:hypothetical protein